MATFFDAAQKTPCLAFMDIDMHEIMFSVLEAMTGFAIVMCLL
jgi:hypothetical protein